MGNVEQEEDSAVPSQACPLTTGGGRKKHATYNNLVKDDNDMVGHVAYALYKRDKLKFCQQLAAEQDRPVTGEQIQTFIAGSNLDVRLAAYRNEAEELLERFSEVMLDEAVKAEQARMEKELLDRLEAAQPFWRGVGQNIVAGLTVIAISALMLVIIHGQRIGYARLLGDIFGYEVTQKPPN